MENKILDIDSALAMMGGDKEIYTEVLSSFIEDVPRLFLEMRNAYDKEDKSTISRNAHSLKSTSRTIGGMRMGAVAEKLEKEAGSTDFTEIKRLIDNILAEFETLKYNLKENGYSVVVK